MKKYLVHIVWAVVVIVALGGGYYWGRASGASARGNFAAGAGAYGSSTRRGGFAGGAGGAGGGFVSGQIMEMDSSSITLQLPSGSSEIVFYSSSTPVTEPTIVSVSKLSVGTNVMVGGTSNSDGSLTAQTIQVRPASPNASQ